MQQLSTKQQRALVAVLLAGGAGAGSAALRKALRVAQKEQVALCFELEGGQQKLGRAKTRRVAVDNVFGARLWQILQICVPSVWSAEAGLIAVQGALLVSRTLLTDYISRIEARAGRNLIQQDFPVFARLTLYFTAVALPAAVVNSGLKWMQKLIKLAFMRRLTMHLHAHYCANRAYYAASTLGGLQQADQRITEDVEKFSYAVSELYGYTFKPLLDVLLFSRSLARVMGYKSQLALYGYYVASAALLRASSPPLALMTAQETALTGQLRSAHQRLVAHSEEVAFNDPPGGAAEQLILNSHLQRLLRHSRLSAFQQFVQQVFDGYFIKYLASTVALFVYAAPLYLTPPQRRGSVGDVTQDYIRSMRLLGNTSRAVGDLVLVYKRLTALAGHTSRVAELLEQVRALGCDDSGQYHEQLYVRNVSSGSCLALREEGGQLAPPPARHTGDVIKFDRVLLRAPGGDVLVRGLSFEVMAGRSVLVCGPNGSGKSSLFRVMAGLWPLQGGEVTLPAGRDVFYLSQRPYLVSGSLADQLLYPLPPQQLWGAAHPAHDEAFQAWLRPEYLDPEALEERMCRCLEAVELDYLLGRGKGWRAVQNWGETLSGGEKQRLAMARLLFHHPKFAVLDECTSAVSADGEATLYQACCRANITLLSIAHRPAVRAFHSVVITFEGAGGGWTMQRLREHDAAPATAEALSPNATLTNAALQRSVSSLLGPGNGSDESLATSE